MEKVLNQLVEKLQKAHGDRLVSVVLYGSAAAGDHHAKFSDLNILCVLSEISPRELGASESIFRWWREKGNPSPLLLTEREVATSTDALPRPGTSTPSVIGLALSTSAATATIA